MASTPRSLAALGVLAAATAITGCSASRPPVALVEPTYSYLRGPAAVGTPATPLAAAYPTATTALATDTPIQPNPIAIK